jgi:fatty acid amide hydrolase
MFFFYGLPRFLQRFVRNLVHIFLSSRMALTMDWVKNYTSDEIDEILRAKDRFERHFNERWDSEKLDGIISPAYYHCAFKNEDDADMGLNADYASLWNIINYPAGVVPVTEVQKGEDTGFTDLYNDMLTKKYKENVEGSAGMPLCVQVATKKWKDEECLAIMRILD